MLVATSVFLVKWRCLYLFCFLQQTMGEMSDELVDRRPGSYFIT